MRKLIFVLLFFGTSLAGCAQNNSVTTFILVRHAEKADDGTQDPELKPEGVERAKRLSLLLKETKLDAIYSTNYKRTRNTVQNVADEKGIKVMTYEPFKPAEIEKLVKKHEGGTVLISGHSNNIPWIANLLTGKQEYKDFSDEDYGNIFIVSVVEKGKTANVLRLRY